MTRLAPASHLLFACSLLCAACGDDGTGEGEEGETSEATGADTDEPVFFPPGTRLIPDGNVWRGCLPDDENCDDDENPGGRVDVSAFFIDRFEATARNYGACINDGVCPEPMDDPDCNFVAGRLDHPMNCLTWDMAKTYCEWRGLRLPTEAEWERAARGDALTLYPWGDNAPDCTLAAVDECGSSSMPVGSLPDGDSPFGIADMTGNVSEWVSDYYDAGYYEGTVGDDDPQGPDSGSTRVVKGSAFTVPGDFPAQRISKRNFATPESSLRIYGVRCARDR